MRMVAFLCSILASLGIYKFTVHCIGWQPLGTAQLRFSRACMSSLLQQRKPQRQPLSGNNSAGSAAAWAFRQRYSLNHPPLWQLTE